MTFRNILSVLMLTPLLASGQLVNPASSVQIRDADGDQANVNTNGSQEVVIVNKLGTPLDSATLGTDTDLDAKVAAVEASVLHAYFSSNETAELRMDAVTHALISVSQEHHEIHEGDHYTVKDVSDLSLNNVIDVQFITPDSTKWTHLVWTLEVESETEWYIYEGAVVTNAGAVITPFDNNRNSSNISTNTIYMQSNTSLANANLDTSVLTATELMHGIIGDGKTGGINKRSNEIILKQNTTYCFRGIANTAGYVDFDMEWYEHINKD